jgi:four helix bundle protein
MDEGEDKIIHRPPEIYFDTNHLSTLFWLQGRTIMDKEKSKRFTDLTVWQKAHAFVLSIYRLSSSFPKSEIYGLTSQLRRAAVSIPANIAEGFKKRSSAEKVRFMNIAQGSLEECRYYLILVNDLKYANSEGLSNQLDEVGRLLSGYSKAITHNSQTKL